MDVERIREQVESFSRWHYPFDLAGVKVEVPANKVNRHLQRERYFFEPLVELMGGSLKGKRVLDLGCNAGYWSLKAVEAGCDFVLGVDGRQMHVDQANLVFGAHEIDRSRYRFELGNIFEYDFAGHGEFDIVLNLGLMYHINRPFELIDRVAAVNTDVMVIDTTISLMPGSCFEVRREGTEDPRNALESEIIIIPTKTALRELVCDHGYDLRVLKPEFSDWSGSVGFEKGWRRAFMCAKQTDLAGLNAATESFDTKRTWWSRRAG